MTFSTRAMRPEDWAGIVGFGPGEFRRPEVMGYEFIKLLSQCRARAGRLAKRTVKFVVSSSSRTPARNETVGGATDSAHLDLPICDAIDLKPESNEDRYWILKAALDLGIVRIGIYANGSVHLDKTEDQRPAPRLWVTARPPKKKAG